MKLAVVGSRDYPDLDFAERFVHMLAVDFSRARLTLEIVSGGARGIDTVAIEKAKEWGLPYKVFEAEWKIWGRANAGKLRNDDIVKYSDAMLAFVHRESEGTMHAIGLAERKGIQIRTIHSHEQGRLYAPLCH